MKSVEKAESTTEITKDGNENGSNQVLTILNHTFKITSLRTTIVTSHKSILVVNIIPKYVICISIQNIIRFYY